MLREAKINLHKVIRGAVIAFVFFAFLFVPVTANANRLREGDAMPPGNNYIPPNSFTNTLPTTPNIRGWRSNMLEGRTLTRREQGLDLRGLIPDIRSFVTASVINEYITDDIVTSLISEARRLRARSISFRYEDHTTDEIVSIVIYADVVTTLPHTLVRSVNFCVSEGRLLSMNEAVGMEIAPLAERILAERIRNNPERYYAALSAPLANQAFYLTNDRLVILFDGFRLSTRVGEVDTIELILENINTVVLTKDDYRPDGPYGLKMIPLRDMLEGQLGFDVDWFDCDDWGNHAIISRNGQNLIELRPDDNEYIVLGTQRRSLEAAPQVIDGRTYIPITFFDQILPLTTFSIGTNGSITFLSYFED